MGVLMFGAGFSGCASFWKQPTLKEFWQGVNEVQASDLVASVIIAARAQTDYSRAFSAAERASSILGGDAGSEQRMKAEAAFKKRTRELGNAKALLASLKQGMSADNKAKFDKYLKDRDINIIMADARRAAVEQVVAADILPSEAKRAVDKLDKNLKSAVNLQSFDGLVQYLDQQLDAQLGKRFGNPGGSEGLCILILLLTSMYIVLLLVAVLVWVMVCILTLGFACQSVTLEDILNDMIDDICA
ncbi:MAG: hypothetical protein PVI71_02670 [Desulfobacterales bacterium]